MSARAVLVLFLMVNAAFAFGRGGSAQKTDYALAGRRVGGLRLAATLAASNLSAFTVFGVPGAAYRMGWAFFPVMATGTSLMALSFLVIGVPLRRLSAERGWTTAADCVAERLGSPALGKAFSTLLLLFTLPYLAIQAGGAADLVASVGNVPRWAASAVIMGTVALYVFRGGLRSVVRTDVLQLCALLILGFGAFVLVASYGARNGAWSTVAANLEPTGPNAPAGSTGTLGLNALAGYYILWLFADPMFPHFLQRFYAADSDRSLLRTMALYPVVCLVVFLPMTAVGVLGAVLVPGLPTGQSDQIFSILARSAGGVLGMALFSTAALAAILSTMDSQLHACAVTAVGDFWPQRRRTARAAARAALVLAGVAWLVSLRPPTTMLAFLNALAFPGYAILAPVILLALYAPAAGALCGWPVLGTGVGLVLLQVSGVFAPPIPAPLFNALAQFGVAILTLVGIVLWQRAYLFRHWTIGHHRESLLTPRQAPLGAPARVRVPADGKWLTIFALLFLAGLPPFFLNLPPATVAGLPRFVWYHIGFVPTIGLFFALFAANEKSKRGHVPVAIGSVDSTAR